MSSPDLSRASRPVFLCLLLVYILYSLPGIDRPWGNLHDGFLQKEKAGFAINYLKLGFRNTGFGQLMDEARTLDSSQKLYSYYIRHPMGISLLTALSFKVFGVKEWASRLVPVLLNIGILVLLYAFFGTYWDRRTSLLALFFVVCSPMFFYIRHLLAFELLALFFISALLYLYARWQTTGQSRYCCLLFVAASLGMLLSDWQVYFFIPGLVAHNLLWARRREKKVLLLLPLACIVFLVYVAYVRWLTGSTSGEGAGGLLWQNMLLRMNLSESAQSANITLSKWLLFFLSNYDRYFTPVLSVLTFLWFMVFLLNVVLKKHTTEQEALLCCCFVSLSLYFAVFSHVYLCCDFMNLFYLPVAGLFGATVIFSTLEVLTAKTQLVIRRTVSVVAVGGCMGLFLLLGYPQARTIFLIQNQELPLNNFFATHGDDILAGFDEDSSFYQLRPYLRLRTVRRVNTLEDFRRAMGEGRRYGYLVMKRGAPADSGLRDFVAARYPSRLIGNSRLEEYDVFDLRPGTR